MRYSNFSQVQFAVQCCCMLLCQRTDSLTAPPLVSWFAAHRAHAGLYVPAKGLSSLTCFPSSFSSSEHKNSSVHPGFLRLQKLTQNQANAALFGGACDDWLFIYSPKFSPGLGYDSWRDVITTRFQRSSVHVHRTSKAKSSCLPTNISRDCSFANASSFLKRSKLPSCIANFEKGRNEIERFWPQQSNPKK